MKTIFTAAAIAVVIGSGAAVIAASGTHEKSAGTGGVAVIRDGETMTQGSGRLVRVARATAPFRRVIADDGVNVEIAFGPRHEMLVEADDNLVGRVTTSTENGELRIGATGSYRTRNAPTVRIVTPLLERVDLHSSSEALLAGIGATRLVLSSNGSGSFRGDGRVGGLEIELSGSGDADLAGLRADDVRIELNGSGEAQVNAARSLRAEVNGSGNIRYAGDPERVERSVHGTGTISPAGR
jgi:hypothetical protein